MKAVIFCGGKGSRLAPVTNIIQKAMLPYPEYVPLLFVTIERLKKNGVNEIILLASHKTDSFASSLVSHFPSMEFLILHEALPTGTGAAISKVSELLTLHPFILVNGDTWMSPAYWKLLFSNIKNDPGKTIWVTMPDDTLFDSKGFFEIKDSELLKFHKGEKDKKTITIHYGDIKRVIYGGIAYITPMVFNAMPKYGDFSGNMLSAPFFWEYWASMGTDKYHALMPVPSTDIQDIGDLGVEYWIEKILG